MFQPIQPRLHRGARQPQTACERGHRQAGIVLQKGDQLLVGFVDLLCHAVVSSS